MCVGRISNLPSCKYIRDEQILSCSLPLSYLHVGNADHPYQADIKYLI